VVVVVVFDSSHVMRIDVVAAVWHEGT